ncbi:TIGR04388 family protein, partial [Leptospira interrogans]
SCQVQDMEASFLYASNMMNTFLNNELLATQGALQSAINYQNGGGASHTYTYGQGTGPYDNQALNYQWGPSGFSHFSGSASLTTAEVSIYELLNGGFTEGAGGLGKKIIQLITGQISQTELANWIMNAYESSMTGEGSYLAGLFGPNGLGPGMTISGISHADLRAFMNEDNDPHPNGGPNQYCPDPIGCYSGNIFAPDPGIYGANDTFSQRGYDFNRYIARELGVWAGVPFLADIEHYQDYAWIELSFTVTNNNAYANVTTYQDLVLQLQGFQHDWMTNVMPSITNWTAQVASYNAQYANWQTQMQTAITDAQNAYNSGVQDIQSQESSWLAQMGQLQQQAQSAFDAASNALKNGQGQGNYGQLTQQILAGLNKGQLQSNISNSTDTMQYGDGFSNILNNLDRNADRGIPNFSLLSTFGSSMSRAITGVSNLTLLSSTNNALMDNILGYMQGVAESMRNEKQFTQNGQQDLIEAHGLKTKTVKTKDKYSGEEISTTYVLDENGNIRMFKDEDGVEKQMTVGDWIQSKEGCGKNLMNGNCNQYIENKYESVTIGSDGTITANRKIYNGTTSQCGADFAQSSSYCYNEDDRVVTITPPNPKALLLGRGASRLGDIFDGRDNGIGELVNTTFQNVGTYLSSNKYTDGLFYDVKNAQMESDHNASIASQDVSNKVKIANLIVDYAQAVLYGGMSTSSWVTKQAHQAVQDVMATALVNTFDFSPEVASFLSSALMTREVARHEKGSFAVQNLGINHAIHEMAEALNRSDLKFLSVGEVLESINVGPNAKKLRAVQDWKDFKYQTYAFGIQQIGKANGLPPETSAAISQAVVSHLRMQSVKEELGMRSGAYSLNAVGGVVRGVLNTVEALLGEIIGGVILKGLAHVSKETGLTSHGYEHTYDKGVQQRIDLLKHREGKEIIKQAAANDVAAYGAIVQAVGDDLHLDPAVTENWVKMTTEFVSRKQAESELHHRNGFWGGKGAVPIVTWVDNTVFSGAITSLLAKAVKGVTTTVGDIGHFISPKSDTFRHSMYQQGNNFFNDMTSTDVKARAQQGIINKAHIESEMRNQLFDIIGEMYLPGDKEAAHNLGLLLKNHIDQKEAKKAAREQRLKDAQMIVQVAAAAVAIYCTAGAAAGGTTSWFSTVAVQTGTTTTASLGGVSTVVATGLTNGQILALAASTAVSMGVEGSINGTNGVLSALVNGVISAVTMGVKTPVTGYVTYNKHENANLLTGQHEVKGGWGGGISANIAGAKSLPLGEAMKAFATVMKMSNLSLGMSYNADAGLGMNINTNFTNKLGLGLDYNFKSGDYTANASYDFDKIGGKKWANANISISASKNGHAGVSASYNNDSNTLVPQALRGGGATIDFGNDGVIGLSVQGPKGATIGTLNYDTNTHGFQPLTLNSNFQNEFNQGLAAHNAAENHQRNQMEILMKEISLGMKMDKPLFTQAEIDAALPRDGKGGIDMEKADPEKLLDKWNAHKEAMSQTPEGLQKWKDEVGRAGERSGIEVKFNEGKSATSTFGKFVTGLMGDVAQSFGFTNDGSKMVDKQGVFHLDTCFTAGSKVTKLKNKNIKIYGNTNVSNTSNGASLNEFSSEDYEFANIEEIKIGDIVRSWNENTNTFENKRVTETFVHEVPQLFFLELDGEEEIHTTWNHPFRRYRATQESESNRNERQSAVGFSSAVYGDSGIQRGFENHSVEHSRNVALENRDILETSQLTPNVSKTLAPSNYSLSTQSEWVKVEDLRLKDQVLRSDGSWGQVTGIYYYNTEPTKVYNLEVEDNHTYVVGGSETGKGYVVHNYSKEHEAVFSKIKNLSKDMFDVAKQFAGLEGGTGNEVYQRAVKLDGEVKATNALRESLKTESNAITLQRDKAEAGLELNKRRNSEFLNAIHNPDSDKIPGVSELRKQLKSVDPVRGFTPDQMKAVTKWVNSNGLNSGLMNTGHGMGMLGGSPIKGYIAAMAGHITGIDEHTKLKNAIQDSNERLAQHKIKENEIGRQMIERSNQAKADLVKLVQERHGNDPRYAAALVEHGLVQKDAFNPNEHKVTYDEKLKAMGDRIKPDTQKKLGEFTSKIADIRVKQNHLEAESYAQWNKEHPNEPYKRTPELEKRRNDMIAMQKNLEKERATIINREVVPFKNENELHRLEKLADAHAITEKQKVELTHLRNEKKTHETQVAALFDKDASTMHNNLETVFGKERISIANDRNDLMKGLEAKETRLSQLDPKKDKAEYDKLNKEIKTINDRTTQLDKNFLEYKPVRKADEPLDAFLLREKDSFAGEPQAIERIVDGLKEQVKHYEALGDVKKVEKLYEKITDYQKRSKESFDRSRDDDLTAALRAGGKEREEALHQIEEYLTHADDRDSHKRERDLPISTALKNPAGNPEGKTISVNSHFGKGGYSNQEVVGSYLHSNDHIGLDVGGPKGERINSVLEGKVKYPPTKGLSITIPGEMPSHLKEKGIAYSEPLYDGNGNKTRNGGYYDTSGNSYTADQLREMDSKYRKANPGLSKGEPLFEATRSVGVITDNGKFYTMANAKTPIELTPAQLALVPEDIRRNPGSVHPSGNSLAIETTLTGPFAGKYEVQYKHFDSAPRYENGDLVKAGDAIKPGQKIGNLGTSGRSTGAHLHMSVVSYEKPNGVSPAFYQVVRDKNKNITHYLINPQYFMKVMAPSGMRK